MKFIGESIKEKRNENKMTQSQLAEKLGISFKYLSDIETGRRFPSETLLKKIVTLLKITTVKKKKKDYSKIELDLLKEIKEKKKILEEINQQIKIKSFEYDKLERTTGVRSKVTWLCIEMQKKMAESITEILSIYNISTPEQQKSMLPALEQLGIHIEKLSNHFKANLKTKDIITEVEEVSKDAFTKYNVAIPKKNIYEFEDEDIVKIITYKVGTIVPRILSDLDKFIDKQKNFTARKTSLLFNGKKDRRKNYQMQNYVSKYVDFFNGMELNIVTALEDMLEEVITDMANYDKNIDRRTLFFNTVDSVAGHTFLVAIGIISLGEYLIKKQGSIANGRYLEQVLIARKDLANKIKSIFKAMNRKELTYEEAIMEFKKMIADKIQEQIKIDVNLYNEIKFENDLYNLCDEDSIEDLFYDTVEKARLKATSQYRMFELK